MVDRLDQCLPQTQCTRCGYPRCRAYADALVRGETAINRCPPGGEATIIALARLLEVPAIEPDPACGASTPRTRAVIDESACIGCRKCLDVCPVDAIVGARKLMHTVIETECNGCGLCLPPCPVDCIALAAVAVAPDPGSLWTQYSRAEAERWRGRTEARLARRVRRRRPVTRPPGHERERIRSEISAAVARVRARRNPSRS